MAFLEIETEPYDVSLDVYFPSDHRMESLSAEELFEIFSSCNEITARQRCEERFQNTFTDSVAISTFYHGEANNIELIPEEISSECPNASPIPSSTVKIATVERDQENFSNSWLVYDEKHGRERRPFLHEFIRMLLDNEQYSHIAAYVDRKRGIFKFFSTSDVAQLWKKVKGRNSNSKMSYDKLARAIRYYYPTGIMQSHPGRYTFRFGRQSGFGVDWFPGDFSLPDCCKKTFQTSYPSFIS